MEHLRILVVIPCLNEEENIAQLVRQLLANDITPMRIAIVDGGSTDRTAEIAQQVAARYKNVFFLRNPKRVQSAAVNLAVATYGNDSEFLIRLDAHATYPDDYCQMLLEEAQDTDASSVVVTMDAQGAPFFQSAVAAAQNSKIGNGGSAHRLPGKEGGWVDHGHHALMRIDAFRQVGGYDETFSHNEDAELDTRLRKAGFSIWLTPRTFLIYHPRSSPISLFRQYVNYGHGRIRTIIKHRAIPKLRQMLPIAVAPAVIMALLAHLSWLMAVPAASWAILCLGYGLLIGRKTGNPHLVLSGPAAMIMHLAWSIGFWQGLLAIPARRLR